MADTNQVGGDFLRQPAVFDNPVITLFFLFYFAELSKLKLVRLDFSYNKVSVIPPAYRLITSLSVLELAHNPLTSPPAQVSDPQTIILPLGLQN